MAKTSRIGSIIWFPCAICTAIVGNAIHHSIFWSICDVIFIPLAWAKWLICQEVNMSIIRSAFSFFFK